MSAKNGSAPWKAAAYARLSDEDRMKSNKQDNSESIGNQLLIIHNWAEQQPDVEIVDDYIDDGYTGLNYDRDDYQRVMRDVDAGKVNMIITKTMSRLGREQAETLMLFKRDFVLKGVRYVAVEDHIDFRGKIDDFTIPFKSLMNDMQSMQTSKDIRSAQYAKAKEGLYMGAYAPYGYVKDPANKNKLIVDPCAAGVVKRIYKMYLSGITICQIKNILNEENVLCPTEYKVQVLNENVYYPDKTKTPRFWTYDTVKRILKNPVYMGSVAQHKMEKVAYNINKLRRIPQEEWIIKENMHEAIISKDDFDTVQRLLPHKRKIKSGDIPNKYVGILHCGDCGRSLRRIITKKKQIKYQCLTYAHLGKKYCSSHNIFVEEIDEVLLMEIQRNIAAVLSEQEINQIVDDERRKRNNQKKNEEERLQIEHDKLLNQKRQMLLKLSKGVIDDEEYIVFKEDYISKIKSIEDKISTCQNSSKCDKLNNKEYNAWIEKFLKYKNIQSIDIETITSLVKRINVYEDGTLEIIFKFKNPFE